MHVMNEMLVLVISGIGGVLVDPLTKRRRFFSWELTAEIRTKLGEGSKKQIIFEGRDIVCSRCNSCMA